VPHVRPTLADWRPRIAKLIRYASVSAIATITSLALLGALVGVGGMSAGWANVIATAIGTIPSFELNRRWVWSQTGRRSILGQAVPFCLFALIELLISTATVHQAGVIATHAHWDRAARTAAVEATSVATFGALWVAQYVLCDRVLFRHRSQLPPPEPGGPEPGVPESKVPAHS
jgi:putative flippase GtrA